MTASTQLVGSPPATARVCCLYRHALSADAVKTRLINDLIPVYSFWIQFRQSRIRILSNQFLPKCNRGWYMVRVDVRAKHFQLASLIVLILILAGVTSGQNAESNSADSKKIRVEKSLRIGDSDIGSFLVNKNLDLGLFRPGVIVHLRLHVLNDSSKSFDFDSVEAGCKCLSVSPAQSRLPPGEKVVFDVEIKVPKKMRSYQEAAFRVRDGAVHRFGVKMRYSGSGVVGFSSTAVRIQMPKGMNSKTVSIPFFADELSPAEFIEVETSTSLSSLHSEMDYQGKQINLTVTEESLRQGRVTGQLRIRNMETDSRGEITVDITEERPTAVYPAVIRLAQEKPEADNEQTTENTMFSGNVMVHSKGMDERASVYAEFTMDGKPLFARKSRGRNGVAFYKIKLDDSAAIELVRQGDATIRCTIVAGKTRDEHVLPVVLSSNSEVR
ncbi:MAG: hypothetical protein F9B45_08165 [Phycisphaera sp. RhM]|nr:hypothetical protein [Phycisphaera sp. RhM]